MKGDILAHIRPSTIWMMNLYHNLVGPAAIEPTYKDTSGRGQQENPAYIRQPFRQGPDFAAESVNLNLQDLLSRGMPPS